MRLSEAIRLGAMTGPQVFGGFEVRGGTCALGAACKAVGLATKVTAGFARVLHDAFPVISRRGVCPVSGRVLPDVGTIIINLNDEYHWTREQIADWVATVEPAETPERQSTTSDVRGEQAQEMPGFALRA